MGMELEAMTAGPSTAVFLHHPQPTDGSNALPKALSASNSPLSQEIHAEEYVHDPTTNDIIKPDPDDQSSISTQAAFDTLSMQSIDEQYMNQQLPVSPGIGDSFGMDEQRHYDFGYTPDFGLGYSPNARGLRYSTSMPHLSSRYPHPHPSRSPPGAMDEVVQPGVVTSGSAEHGGDSHVPHSMLHDGYAYPDMQTFTMTSRDVYPHSAYEPSFMESHEEGSH